MMLDANFLGTFLILDLMAHPVRQDLLGAHFLSIIERNYTLITETGNKTNQICLAYSKYPRSSGCCPHPSLAHCFGMDSGVAPGVDSDNACRPTFETPPVSFLLLYCLYTSGPAKK